MIAHAFPHPCGEWIGISDHPANSFEDGRELGPLYLTRGGCADQAFGAHLWPLGSGDAGYLQQRCPKCEELLIQGAAQTSLLG